MRLVGSAAEMASAWERARSEARKFFGDDTVYLEKAIDRPRHVEIQVLGDREGNSSCTSSSATARSSGATRRSSRRRPAPPRRATSWRGWAPSPCKARERVGYFSAGTFEFLLAPDGSFYFLEMNTRLQVEHPVTELVTGLDLVREMVRVAQGEALDFGQEDLASRGAAIECRVYAEDPSNGFLPSPGVIERLAVPAGPGVRDDGGAYPGCEISSFYDPLISKLSVWAPTRDRAVARMRRALSEYVVSGIRTNLAFHDRLLAHPEFAAGRYDTSFIERYKDELLGDGTAPPARREAVAVAVAVAAARRERTTGASPAPSGRQPVALGAPITAPPAGS